MEHRGLRWLACTLAILLLIPTLGVVAEEDESAALIGYEIMAEADMEAEVPEEIGEVDLLDPEIYAVEAAPELLEAAVAFDDPAPADEPMAVDEPEIVEDAPKASASVDVELGVKQTYKLNASKLAKGKKLTFKSSKPKIASVDAKGVVTARKKGKAVITCYNGKKKLKSWTIQVLAAPKSVSLGVRQLSMGVKESVTLSPVIPSGSKAEFTWTTSNVKVVKVKNGKLTGVKKGNATVTVQTQNGKKASVAVTVLPAPDQVILSQSSLTLDLGVSYQLVASLPANTASSKLTWSSDNPGVAMVGADGVVTAVAGGVATIAVTAFNGRQGFCTVVVNAPVITPEPTPVPTPVPTLEPTLVPAEEPEFVLTPEPTVEPTPEPTAEPPVDDSGIDGYGALVGSVRNAVDRSSPVSNAFVVLKVQGSTYRAEATDEDGGYVASDLKPRQYEVHIEAEGFVPFTGYATVRENEMTYMETFLMVEGTAGQLGTASGVVTNALTGEGVENADLEVREGWNNTEGNVIITGHTNGSGKWQAGLPIGNYTLSAVKYGFIRSYVNLVVLPGVNTRNQNLAISPEISSGEYRVKLTWGASPRDLDSHMTGYKSNGGSFHVYYRNKNAYEGDMRVCNLDVDDTNGYGPEVVTLDPVSEKPYYYYVHNYSARSSSGNNDLSTRSGARIELYRGSELLRTFNVPTDQGEGIYWNVFAIVNGEIVVRNTITRSPDTSYVDEPNSSSYDDED